MINVRDLFIKYASVNTQSQYDSETFPSTKCQLDFMRILADDCKAIGLEEVELNGDGYVYATLPSNLPDADGQNPCPTVGFIAHVDTSPDCSGENVKPKIIESYDGNDIRLENGLILSPNEFPNLKKYVGQELITTDGRTLLGADDKAGISEILAAMDYLIRNPHIKHGKIRIAFTPDEEIGKGADKFDVKGFGADFAYTIDGEGLGELECESFNAARAKIYIKGKSVHPGYAKDVMVNASLLAFEINAMLPADEIPAKTSDRQGYFHLTKMSGSVENAYIEFTIRDFETQDFNNRKDLIIDAVCSINRKYSGEYATLNLYDEYFNMHNILKKKTQAFDVAEKAIIETGVKPVLRPIRGGTDGSRLSFMGLPCPNIFAGAHNFHGPFEFISVPSMHKAVEVIVKICENAVDLSIAP